MNDNVTVEFGPKFCQAQFEDFLMTRKWEQSFSITTITTTFDLSLTEWVSTEQICFLFAWIRNLKLLSKSVIIKLPFRHELKEIYSPQQLDILSEEHKNPISGEKFFDSETRKNRRRRSAAFLMDAYGMYDKLELGEEDFLQIADYSTYNKETQQIRKNNHQIIGFTPFELTIIDSGVKYDTHFYELISNSTETKTKTKGLFELQTSVQQLLKKYGCYNPFESKILSNVITQELFTNSLQHSFEVNSKKLVPECYITAFLANKWEDQTDESFHQVFLAEKYPEAIDFFKDKNLILSEINSVLKRPQNKNTKSRQADLKSFTSHFKNQSYLEYTFLDFGDSIAHSLVKEFESQLQANTLPLQYLSVDFLSANKDSQIIEYAFLMDSSKNPLDKRIEYFDLIPRGLYFLIDMIRRYKGMLIVRSAKGKVIFDFSDKIIIKRESEGPIAILQSKFTIADSVKHSSHPYLHSFPGTMFTVVIPGLEEHASIETAKSSSGKSTLGAVRPDDPQLAEYAYSVRNMLYQATEYPEKKFTASRFQYVGILLLYNKVLDELKKNAAMIGVGEIYNKLLLSVNRVLDSLQNTNCIVFFDFAGLRSGNALWIKILYYLINTPKINERTKAIIFNLPSDEQRIVHGIKENLSGYDKKNGKPKKFNPYDPFLYKPIPCISYKIDEKTPANLIEWIGLRNAEDEELLTALFLGERQQYSISKFESAESIIGNLFVQNSGWVKSTFSGLGSLNNLFLTRQKEATIEFLKSHIVDGIERSHVGQGMVEKESTVFLTANGGFQLQYLTLYELLHDKLIARYFAKCLLDKYAAYVQMQLSISRAGNFDDIHEYSFTKIIAVTVSSQLIGIAIRDLIIEDDCYTFLRKETESDIGPDLAPELIMLSSYYSFDVEKPFEKITGVDRVLIVNDVISTGRLVGKLLQKIEEEKEARVNCVFSITDARIPPSERILMAVREEEESIFFDLFESRFVTLAAFDDGIQLRKYKGPYSGDARPKRINPLLNTIVELKAEHAENRKVLFPALPAFLEHLNIEESYLNIGHFQQNMTHNGYLINMRSLFGGQRGVDILEKLRIEIEKKGFQTANGSPRKFIINRLSSIDQQVDKLVNGLSDARYKEKIKSLRTAIAEFQTLLIAEEPPGGSQSHFRPGFIFYPVFSGIDRAHYLKLSEIFDTHPDNIIGLQRFDTPKGWRFPFPAKRYNELTRNQSVLILDAGSLTGESLVQLIDNIGFLDVKEILVLCVISRVEDFYREFYSRLKSLNVKKLKTKDSEAQTSLVKNDNIVPIEIVFGISLHIPVYSSFNSCPFCEELNFLSAVSDSSHYAKQTHQVKAYVKMRREELKPLNNTTDQLKSINYLPTDRKTGRVDTKGVFDTRDIIGKIDSYRFYPEYFSELNDLQESIINNNRWFNDARIQLAIERIMICILHEPHLLDLIESYGNGLDKNLKSYIQQFAFSDDQNELTTYYQWSHYATLQLCFTLLKSSILSITYFLKILAWDDEDCHLLMHFKLWDILHGRKSKAIERDSVETMLKRFTDMYNEVNNGSEIFVTKNKEYSRILIRNYDLTDITGYEKLDIPFYNLSKFVYQGELQDRHFFLKESLNHIIDAIISTKPSIEQISTKVYDVLYIFDEELKPSIEKIVSDPAVRDTCKVLFAILGDKSGILSYMNRIEAIYQEIVHVKQADIKTVQNTFPVLQDICRNMVNKILTTTEDYECFYRICKEYPWSLTGALQNIQTKQTQLTSIEFFPGVVPDVNVAIHRQVIEAILEEILKNARARYPMGVNLSIYYSKTPDGEYVKLTISQDKPFLPPIQEDRLGGLHGIVKYFVEKFEGSYSDNREESIHTNIDFEIVLQLKLHTYVK